MLRSLNSHSDGRHCQMDVLIGDMDKCYKWQGTMGTQRGHLDWNPTNESGQKDLRCKFLV